jgi:hypothetical protein
VSDLLSQAIIEDKMLGGYLCVHACLLTQSRKFVVLLLDDVGAYLEPSPCYDKDEIFLRDLINVRNRD